MKKPTPARQGFYAQLPAAVIREIKTQAREQAKATGQPVAQWRIVAATFQSAVQRREAAKKRAGK